MRPAFVLALAMLANACSPAPMPVSTSPHDPSNPSGPEGRTPAPPPSSEPAPSPGEPPAHQGHSGHGAPATDAGSVVYTCPMHPEVTSPTPGSCPKCGMHLVPKS
jgi:hypothetical protein